MNDGGFTPSTEQLDIFDWFRGGAGNLVVAARAGTGKTTTIKKAFALAPETKILYAVFGKRNQKEAEVSIRDPRVEIKTLHSLGYAYIRQNWRGVRPDDAVEWDRIETVSPGIPDTAAGAVERLIGFAKNTSIVIPTLDALMDLAERKQIECPELEPTWTVVKLAETALKALKLAMVPNSTNTISFNDMVWLPVVMNWVRPWYQLVCIDEAQDMNAPQLMMAQKACKRGGRIAVVGDDRQAIFGFRGAVQDGMTMMQKRLEAPRLTLTVTYRCPKSVVALAAQLVPDYRCADTAPEGTVEQMSEFEHTLKVGDAVLARVNAPLMGICLRLLKAGISARIEGKDIGRQLLGLVRKMKARSVPDFLKRIKAWSDRSIARATGTKNAEAKIETIQDQADTMTAVAEGAVSVADIEARILSLFSDSQDNPKPAVVLSTTHKAKGLEFEKVYVMLDTYKVKPGAAPVSEEANLTYVAVTRAKQHLVLVGKTA